MVARLAYDHPLHPTVPHRDPTAMAWRLRSGRWRRPNRATAVVVARLVFTISGQSRAFTALRLSTCHGRAQPHQRACDAGIRLAAVGAPRGRTCARWRRTRASYAGALLPHAHWHRRACECDCRGNAAGRGAATAHVLPIEMTTGYRRPDGQWPPRCPVAWLVHEFNARVASQVDAPDPHDRRLGPDQFVVSLRHYRPAEGELSRERLKSALSTAEGLLLQPRGEGELIEFSDDEAVAAAVMLPMVAADRRRLQPQATPVAPSSATCGALSDEAPALTPKTAFASARALSRVWCAGDGAYRNRPPRSEYKGLL